MLAPSPAHSLCCALLEACLGNKPWYGTYHACIVAGAGIQFVVQMQQLLLPLEVGGLIITERNHAGMFRLCREWVHLMPFHTLLKCHQVLAIQ